MKSVQMFWNRSRRTKVISIAAVVTLLFSGAVATAAAVGTKKIGLVYSTDQALTTTKKLSHSSVSGTIYVLIDGVTTISASKFYLDDANGAGTPIAESTNGAMPTGLDTTKLTAGMHTLLVVITQNTGKVSDSFARFLVDNSAATPQPTAVPTATTAPQPAATVAPRVNPTVVPTAPATTAPTATPANGQVCGGGAAPTTYKHVIWIWMENKDRSEVTGNANFIDSLAAKCGQATNYADNGLHPSEPNYIEATSGGTQGISNDDDATKNAVDAPNIFGAVRAAGKTSKGYIEDMPDNCAMSSSGDYASKHNPEPFYKSESAACATDNVPFSKFSGDLASGNIGDYVTIVPNLCNDMHDCDVATGDAWLQTVVGDITSSAMYAQGGTAVFILWDESNGGGTIPFIAASPSIKAGTSYAGAASHDGLLRTTLEMLGVSTFPGKSSSAASMRTGLGL